MKNILALGLASIMMAGCTQIEDGTVGLEKVYGEVNPQPVRGFVWYNPWSTDIIIMNTKSEKIENKLTTPTADIQQITITSTANARLIAAKASEMYIRYGTEWKDQILPQILNSVQKNEIGRWRAVDIISNRSQVEANIQNELAKQLLAKGVQLEEYSLTGTSFSEAFMDAVEAKEIAVQNGIAAKNQTVKIEEEAKQAVITAEGEAKALLAKGQAANNPNVIRLRELDVQEKAIAAWNNGAAVPSTVFGGSGAGIPFINVPLGGAK